MAIRKKGGNPSALDGSREFANSLAAAKTTWNRRG
jgi:hypothetical protein